MKIITRIQPALSSKPTLGKCSRTRQASVIDGDFTLYVWPSQTIPLSICFLKTLRLAPMQPYNPSKNWFGLFRFRSPLLSESPGDRSPSWFLFPSYLDGSVHSVWLYYPILFRYIVTGSLPPGYPIRLSRDHRICAPSPGFSQLITAFFAK